MMKNSFIILTSFLCCLFSFADSLAHPSHAGRLELAERLVREKPEDSKSYLKRGEAYLEVNHFSEAEKDFILAAQLDTVSGLPELSLARFFYRRARFEEALASLEKALSLNDKLIAGKLLRAQVYRGLKRYDAAARELSSIIRSANKPSPDLFLERDEYFALDTEVTVDQRLDALREGLESVGIIPVLVRHVVTLETKAGRFEKALEELERLPLKLQEHPECLVEKAQLLELLEKPLEAKQVYSEALERILSLPERRQNNAKIQNLKKQINSTRFFRNSSN